MTVFAMMALTCLNALLMLPRAEAVKSYSQAIAGCQSDHTLFSNRSAAYLATGMVDEAIEDAKRCIELAPHWPKGYYRLGAACLAKCEWSAAVQSFKHGLELSPDSKDMV